jgi:hypothetical protein
LIPYCAANEGGACCVARCCTPNLHALCAMIVCAAVVGPQVCFMSHFDTQLSIQRKRSCLEASSAGLNLECHMLGDAI